MSLTGGPEEPRAEPPARRPNWGAIALVGLTGFAMLRSGLSDEADGPPQPGGGAAPAPAPVRGRPSGPAPLARSAVTRVTIPSLGISAPVVPLGLDKDGWIAAPPARNPRLAGWYAQAPAPGERGTAVIVGHVDTYTGPAVFYRLGTLEKGRTIRVTRKDGRTVVFEIYGIRVFAKDRFPARQVYGATGRPELRLLTCGGGYSASGGYAGNVVVFARMTGTDPR
ncbi:class F sortase [Streptomyces chattanoogensis]|uniref:Peptidase C60 n=1 Tax=Streptomyces chattanoogensis TaxID=66876 RepID=A0A0N0H0Y8_9ACTN|nr:class F sortase [Streptomyces chattanoogensis]KPC64032.1 peptidase C60 [Streptomyces chattanoogensis]